MPNAEGCSCREGGAVSGSGLPFGVAQPRTMGLSLERESIRPIPLCAALERFSPENSDESGVRSAGGLGTLANDTETDIVALKGGLI